MSRLDFEPFTEELPCALTEEEAKQKALESTRMELVLHEFQKNAKLEKQKLKSQEDTLQNERHRLAVCAQTKVETRPVECYDYANLAEMTIETYRRDREELIRTRAMNDEERKKARQMEIGFSRPERVPRTSTGAAFQPPEAAPPRAREKSKAVSEHEEWLRAQEAEKQRLNGEPPPRGSTDNPNPLPPSRVDPNEPTPPPRVDPSDDEPRTNGSPDDPNPLPPPVRH